MNCLNKNKETSVFQSLQWHATGPVFDTVFMSFVEVLWLSNNFSGKILSGGLKPFIAKI